MITVRLCDVCYVKPAVCHVRWRMVLSGGETSGYLCQFCRDGLKPDEVISEQKQTTEEELDNLLLATARLLKDARLAARALQDPGQVTGGRQSALSAVHISVEEGKTALFPFLERLDEVRQTRGE